MNESEKPNAVRAGADLDALIELQTFALEQLNHGNREAQKALQRAVGQDAVQDARYWAGWASAHYNLRNKIQEVRAALLTRRDQPEQCIAQLTEELAHERHEKETVADSAAAYARWAHNRIQELEATRRDVPQEPPQASPLVQSPTNDARTPAWRETAGNLSIERRDAKSLVGRDADHGKGWQVVANLKNALERLIEATQLPETCVHDAEPDYCDGCRYAMEKATQMARIHARAALDTIPAAHPDHGTAPAPPTER